MSGDSDARLTAQGLSCVEVSGGYPAVVRIELNMASQLTIECALELG